MAFCSYWGNMAPEEYEDMEATATAGYVRNLKKIVDAEREMQVTLAKFIAGSNVRRQAAEVRG